MVLVPPALIPCAAADFRFMQRMKFEQKRPRSQRFENRF